MVGGRALRCGGILGESDSRLTVLTIIFIIFEGRREVVQRAPAEILTVFLTVLVHTFFSGRCLVCWCGVPTKLPDFTFVCLDTNLIDGLQLGTCVSPRPLISRSTVELLVTVSVTVAVFTFRKALTLPIQAVMTYALP